MRLRQWPFWLFALPTIILGGMALGMIAQKRIWLKPAPGMAYGVDSLSNGGLGTFAREVGRAQQEVLVSAHQITSEKLVFALCAASQRGVRVRVLLDGIQNADPSRGALRVFLSTKTLGVRTTKQPLLDQFLIVDQDRVYFTAAPWTTAAASADAEASAVVIQHPGFTDQMRNRFQRLYDAAVRR